MIGTNDTKVGLLVEAIAGRERARRLFAAVEIDVALLAAEEGPVSRAEMAEALNLLLFDEVLRRVPQAVLYVEDRIRKGEKVDFDHGALRTVRVEAGNLPAGQDAFARILRPLGYEVAGLYPLDQLKMTGRAWRHLDFPETVPQFFVSELHPERFSPEFQDAVNRVLSTSHDPLSSDDLASLATLEAQGHLSFAEAVRLLPNLLSCFERQHAVPALADYEILLAESREMAWISTEGNAFNHATDRVADVEAVAAEQHRLGRSMKDRVEVSASGRVIQTAYRAARVERPFVDAQGQIVAKTVPGSFFEFITRERDEAGRLDLGFDTGNAQAIFKMTAVAA